MKKALWILTLALSVPAFAQRGGAVHTTLTTINSCSNVVANAGCAGYGRVVCVDNATDIEYWCNPITLTWEQISSSGTTTVGGGGISTVKEGTTTITSSATTFVFSAGFDLVASDTVDNDDTANISLDYSEDPVNLAGSDVTNTLQLGNGGTGATTAVAALSALGGATRGINTDITALTNLTSPLSPSQGGTGLSTSTSLTDKVAVGQSSTLLAYTAIPDCDATGNQLGYVASSHTFECAADGAGGSGIEASEEGSDVTAAARSRINFAGAAFVTATDNTGASRVDVTFSVSPDSSSAVGTGRTITPGAGLSGSSALDLSANRTLATDSTEAAFLADGAAVSLTCGASNQGKAQVMDAGPLQWCDGATTSVLHSAAFADVNGNALTGDSATSFFGGGIVEVVRGGTGASTIGSDTQCLFNDGGAVGADGGCTYNKTTDTLTVASVVTNGAADNARYLELQQNSGDVAAPSSGFARFYGSGTAGSEVPKFRTFTGGVQQISVTTATETLTNKTLTTPVETGKIDRNNSAVDDDDCTGEIGSWWYDTTDSAFEFCNANSGAPSTLAAAAGDVTDVWQCASGDCSTLTGTTGDSLDASAADSLRVPVDKTISASGMIGVDTTSTTGEQLKAFIDGAVRVFSPTRSTGAVITSLSAADDNFEFFEAPENVTITGVSCHCRGTCSTTATFTLEDRGGNGMTITGTNPTCSTTTGNSTFAAVTAANSLVAGEGLAFDVTNTPTTGDVYTITVTYTIDAQ